MKISRKRAFEIVAEYHAMLLLEGYLISIDKKRGMKFIHGWLDRLNEDERKVFEEYLEIYTPAFKGVTKQIKLMENVIEEEGTKAQRHKVKKTEEEDL